MPRSSLYYNSLDPKSIALRLLRYTYGAGGLMFLILVDANLWRWEMSEPILVQPTGPKGHMPPETVQGLIEDLRGEGLDARLAYEEIPGGGVSEWDLVMIWIALRGSEAVINQVVGLAVEWMKNRFRQDPEDTRPRAAQIILYEGDEGEVSVVVELKSADEEPVRRTPEDFERYTRKKPAEGITRREL